jgi:hypothetical protein
MRGLSTTPDIEPVPPCPVCNCRAVFQAVAPTGQREQPIYLRCCECGRERADLEFYEEAAA